MIPHVCIENRCHYWAHYLGWKIKNPLVLTPKEYPRGPSCSLGANVSNRDIGMSIPTIPTNVWLSLSYNVKHRENLD